MPSDTIRDFSCGVIPYRINAHSVHEFLLIQHNAGHWAFPKGHPEQGETNLQTAKRELAEETGLTDVVIYEQHPLEEQYTFTKRSGKQVDKRVLYFLGQVASDQAVVLQQAEVSNFFWGDAKQTRRLLSFDEGRQLFDQALTCLQAK